MNWKLTIQPNGKVRYMMENGAHPVLAETREESARWMLDRGHIHESEVFPGFPITADDKFFFEGEVEVRRRRKRKAEVVKAEVEVGKIEVGEDGYPLPAGPGKKRGRRTN